MHWSPIERQAHPHGSHPWASAEMPSTNRLAFIRHYLLATVKTISAYVMSTVGFTGCAFNGQCGVAQRIVRASLTSARPCHLAFLYCHFKLSLIFKRSLIGRYRGPFPLCSPKERLHKSLLRRWPALRFILAAAFHRVSQPSKWIPSRFVDVDFWPCFFTYFFTVYAVIH